MEPLWSPVVATGGNRSQIAKPKKPQKQAKTVAVRCDRLPEKFHGKEGVDGSSPSEGLHKSPANAELLLSGLVALLPPRSGMEQIMEQPGTEARDFVVSAGNEAERERSHAAVECRQRHRVFTRTGPGAWKTRCSGARRTVT